MNYDQLLNKYGSDKGSAVSNGLHYGDFYERYFKEFRESAQHVCEIGIEGGCSLRANEEYFLNAIIHGVDIGNKKIHETSRIKTYILDQSVKEHLQSFTYFMKSKGISFDIIIDDGSHDVAHQQLTLGILFPLLKDGGLYVIEDMGSSFFQKGSVLYGYEHTEEKVLHNTVKFLTNRPFNSPWIEYGDLKKLEDETEFVIVFDRPNKSLSYAKYFACINDYPIRAITSIIKKRTN